MLVTRKRKLLLQALLSLLFIALLFGGAWYFATSYKPPTTEDYVNRGRSYLEEAANALGVEAKVQESVYWSWIDEKGQILPLIGNQFLLGTVDVNGIGKYGDVTSKHLEKVTDTFFRSLLADSETFFNKSHFVANKENAREKENDPTHTIRRGYERGKIKCLLRLTPHSDPFGAFFCGAIGDHQLTLQKRVAGLFSTTYNPKHFSAFRVTKSEKDFALGTYMEDVGGYTWIAKKTEGKWQVVWKGQEIPLCTDMQKGSIPKTIYLNCSNGE